MHIKSGRLTNPRMLGGIVDITARKRAESRLAEREAQLALFTSTRRHRHVR
jgi:hypothetical protein